MSQEEHDPDNPDVSNVYDFNDAEDPTIPIKQEIEVTIQRKIKHFYLTIIINSSNVIFIQDSGEEDDKSKIVKLVPKKSQTVTQAHMCNYCNYTTGKR